MITALVLAAGLSTRMGQPKMLLPWGGSIVIDQVVNTLIDAQLDDICVVTGGSHEEIKEALTRRKAKLIYNPDYANGEMLSSVQLGLRSIRPESEAALIVLGDQPQIEIWVIKAIVTEFRIEQKSIVVPSYQMHRGHPWLIERSMWEGIQRLEPPSTLHDFLLDNQGSIAYVNVDTTSILQDLDTPEDYHGRRPT